MRSSVVTANAIRMKRSHHNGCFLIVEGRDDRLFFEQVVDLDACSIQVAQGKPNVIDVICILDADRFSGVVGVVDADLDHVEGHYWSSRNIIMIETYDLEALLIKSTALDRVLVEFGSSKKIADRRTHPRDELVNAALPIGCFRLHSRRSGLNLTFDGMRYARFVDRDSLRTDVPKMVQEVKDRSQRPKLAAENTGRDVRGIQATVSDPWLVCCGTDMVAVLGIGLGKALGNKKTNAVKPDVLRQSLRLAYERHELIDSRLGQDLHEWADRNPGFQVLRA